jgi:hypothetical protein
VYLLPARRYQNRWVPQGTIFGKPYSFARPLRS